MAHFEVPCEANLLTAESAVAVLIGAVHAGPLVSNRADAAVGSSVHRRHLHSEVARYAFDPLVESAVAASSLSCHSGMYGQRRDFHIRDSVSGCSPVSSIALICCSMYERRD